MQSTTSYLDLLLAGIVAEILGNEMHTAPDALLEEAAFEVKTFRDRWAKAIDKANRRPIDPMNKYPVQ